MNSLEWIMSMLQHKLGTFSLVVRRKDLYPSSRLYGKFIFPQTSQLWTEFSNPAIIITPNFSCCFSLCTNITWDLHWTETILFPRSDEWSHHLAGISFFRKKNKTNLKNVWFWDDYEDILKNFSSTNKRKWLKT